MGSKVKIDGLADAVMKELESYADVIDADMRKAVTKAGQTVRKEISAGAPVGHTGKYAKSWSTKKTRQTARSLEVTVYSRNRYQLAHLLEHGHARRGGGRTRAQVILNSSKFLHHFFHMIEIGRASCRERV